MRSFSFLPQASSKSPGRAIRSRTRADQEFESPCALLALRRCWLAPLTARSLSRAKSGPADLEAPGGSSGDADRLAPLLAARVRVRSNVAGPFWIDVGRKTHSRAVNVPGSTATSL